MLTKLELCNFQAHKRLVTDIAPITIIAGRSDSGKSSSIRALLWLLYNRGTSKDYMRHGTTEVTVTCEIDGRTVTRSSQHNAYVLDGVESRVVGKSVPDDIGTLFNVLSDNTQTQHDPFYWFSENGSGLVAKIEETFGLKMPATWMQSCKQEQLQHSRTLKRHEQEKQELESDINQLQQFEQINDKLKELDDTIAHLENTKRSQDTLQSLLCRLLKARMGIVPRSVLDAWNVFIDVSVRIQKLSTLRSQLTLAKSQICVIPDINKLHAAFERSRMAYSRYERLQTLTRIHSENKMQIKVLPDIDKLQAAFNRSTVMHGRLKQLQALVQVHHENKTVMRIPDYIPLLNVLQKLFRCDALSKKYKDASAAAANARDLRLSAQKQADSLLGKICPTCGQPIQNYEKER